MNRAQRVALVVGLFALLVALGIALAPFRLPPNRNSRACGPPLTTVSEKATGLLAGRPSVCSEFAKTRLQVAGTIASLAVVGTGGALLILREPKAS